MCLPQWWAGVCGSFPRDGHPLTDDEVAGMLIGLLLAGQHTSSTTGAWLGFFLARDKTLQEKCYLEQKTVCGEGLPPLTYDQVRWIFQFHCYLKSFPS
jgi:sterol 14-demethylase